MKLPIVKGVAAGFAYFFTHILEIVRGVWLPALLLQAALAYIMPHYFKVQLAMQSLAGDPSAALSAMGSSMGWVGLILLATAIFYPMMQASILRPLVRGERPSLPFYLQYGGDEFRLLFTLILFVVMMIIVDAVAWIGGLVAFSVLAAALKKIGLAIGAVLLLAIAVGVIWFLLRMSVIFPATVGAKRIGLAESWRVTKGNVWRLFFYWILWGIVLLLFGCIFMAFAMSGLGPLVHDLFHRMKEAGQDHAAMHAAMKEWQQHMLQLQASMWDPSKPGFWVFQGATYIYSMLKVAIINVAGGVAYRFLTDGE